MNDKQQLPDDIETPILGMPPLPVCQNCDGSGTVVSYVTGELLACWFCKGTGIAPFAVAPGGGGGNHVSAFDASTIVEVRAASLRSRAIVEVRAWTASGTMFVRNANDIRWSEAEPYGAIRVGGQWIPQLERGLVAWAIDECLNWRKPDGTIVEWQKANVFDFAGVGGGGGGAYDVSTLSESLINSGITVHTLDQNWSNVSRMLEHDRELGGFLDLGWTPLHISVFGDDMFTERVVTLRAPQSKSLLKRETTVGAGYCSNCGYYWYNVEGGEHFDPVTKDFYCHKCHSDATLLDQPTVGGGGGDPDGQHKPLHSMTADEARTYALRTWDQILAMVRDLNQIPGVTVNADFRISYPDEERIPVLEVDDTMGETYMVTTTDDAVSLVREMLEDWETFDVNEEIVVRVSLAHPNEIAALQMDDEGGAA